MSDQASLAAGAILWTPQRKMSDFGDLPIKVRAHDGALVGAGVSGQPIAVPPGEYWVSVSLPGGQEICSAQATRVVSGKTATPKIRLPDEATYTKISSRMNASALQMTELLTAETLTTATAPADGRDVTAQQWQGHWLGGWKTPKEAMAFVLPEEALTLSETDQVPLFADYDHDRFLITRHRDAAEQAILRFTIVPHDEALPLIGKEGEARLILATVREGSMPPAIKYASQNNEANTLLNYVDAGVYSEMETVASGFMRQGAVAMQDPRMSLLRALVGAYVKMRVNATDGMEEWLGALARAAPFLPDTYTLQAELFARKGRHAEAAAALRQAMHALCPWFRAGISYMLERLKLYTELGPELQARLALSEEDWDLFRLARHRLELLAPMMVMSQVFTTFDIPE